MTSSDDDQYSDHSSALESAASHQMVIRLRPGRDTFFFEPINALVGRLALTPGCYSYTLAPHPNAARTWLIQGDWHCPAAMNEHFSSQPMQELIGQLCSMNVYRVLFNCEVPEALTSGDSFNPQRACL